MPKKTGKDQDSGLKIKRSRRRLYEDPEPVAAKAEQVAAAKVDVLPPGPVPESAKDARAETKEHRAQKIIRKYQKWSLGLGLVPFPLLDTLTISTAQAFLIRDLARLYEVDFSMSRSKVLLTSLLSGAGSVFLAVGVWVSFLKFVPLAGTALGVATLPILAASVTYAVGQVFSGHFESGGTLDDFDPTTMRCYFSEHLKAGRKKARHMQKTQAG